MYKGIATSAHHIRPVFPAKGPYWIIIQHMLVLTDNQLRTVMDTAGQLPRLKFIALWGVHLDLRLSGSGLCRARRDDHHRDPAEGWLADRRLH
jgi:hypothetical protein